jgi:hypothetical protein
MRTEFAVALMALVTLVAVPSPAAADVTAFWGTASNPTNRSAKGFSLGINLVVLGFEFEYGNMSEDLATGAPALRTGMLNGLVQTPTGGTQFYLTAGGGFYRERLDDDSTTSVGTNIGGGVKVRLAGPLRLRLDYRVFNLRGSPLYSSSQRFYAGANIAF